MWIELVFVLQTVGDKILCTQMSNVTVFVFLLESITGFESTLKSTLQDISVKYYDNNILTKCDPNVANFLWKNINENTNLLKEVNLLSLRFSKNFDNHILYPEEGRKSLENNYIENNIINNDKNYNKYNYNKSNNINKYNYKSFQNNEFPRNASNLVAIFETITNITAQTCGGTLLSSHWVLTAASCLDLLPYFYNNFTKQNIIYKSYYTIIANGKNPLLDGTVHNVREIILHPKYKKNRKRTESQVMLMKIEPAANVHSIPIFKDKIKKGIYVKVYGWTLQKNSTGEYMAVSSISARIIDSKICKSNNNFVDYSSIICLSADDESKVKISQMSSGGPVLVNSKGILKIVAVAQIDTSSQIIAYSLTNYDWIDDVINK